MNNKATLKLFSPTIADLCTLNFEVYLLDIGMWGFDHGAVHVFTLLGLWIGSLFLSFWDKAGVPY